MIYLYCVYYGHRLAYSCNSDCTSPAPILEHKKEDFRIATNFLGSIDKLAVILSLSSNYCETLTREKPVAEWMLKAGETLKELDLPPLAVKNYCSLLLATKEPVDGRLKVLWSKSLYTHVVGTDSDGKLANLDQFHNADSAKLQPFLDVLLLQTDLVTILGTFSWKSELLPKLLYQAWYNNIRAPYRRTIWGDLYQAFVGNDLALVDAVMIFEPKELFYFLFKVFWEVGYKFEDPYSKQEEIMAIEDNPGLTDSLGLGRPNSGRERTVVHFPSDKEDTDSVEHNPEPQDPRDMEILSSKDVPKDSGSLEPVEHIITYSSMLAERLIDKLCCFPFSISTLIIIALRLPDLETWLKKNKEHYNADEQSCLRKVAEEAMFLNRGNVPKYNFLYEPFEPSSASLEQRSMPAAVMPANDDNQSDYSTGDEEEEEEEEDDDDRSGNYSDNKG